MDSDNKENQTIRDKSNEFRRTHFSLGNYENNPFRSEMKIKFDNQQDSAINEHKKDTNPQKTHFKLGNADDRYKTSNLAHYQDKSDKVEMIRLPQDKIDDLRATHIVYGNYGNQHLTEQNLRYGVKEFQQGLKEKQEQQKQKMRRHHHDFKEDNQHRFDSQYTYQYQDREPAPDNVFQQRMVINKQNQKEMKTKSHILLGQQFLSKQSIQQSDYQEKEQPGKQKARIDQTQTHYALGENMNDFQTMNQMYYKAQKGEANMMSEEQMQRLRDSHFGLGADKNYRLTENMAQYCHKNNENDSHQQSNWIKHKYSQNHVHLGKDGANHHTNYRKSMTDYTEEILKGERTRPIYNDCKVNVGNIPNDYISENVKQYGYDPKKIVENNIDPLRKQQIQMSHLKFNDVARNEFKSVQRASYQDRPCEANNLTEEQLNYLRSTHFQLGDHQPKIQTDYQREFCNTNNQKVSQSVNYMSNKSNWKLG